MQKAFEKAKKIFRNGPPKFLFPLLAVGLVASAAYLKFREEIIVARVNGRPVYRWELVRELEKTYGPQALDGLITKKLVYQEAKKQGVSVSPEELSEEVANLDQMAQAQGADLEQVLGAYGVDRAGLEETLRYQILITKLADTGVSVTDEEVDEYWEQSKAQFSEDTEKEDVVESLRESLRQQKSDQKINEWMQELQEKSKIKQFLTFR